MMPQTKPCAIAAMFSCWLMENTMAVDSAIDANRVKAAYEAVFGAKVVSASVLQCSGEGAWLPEDAVGALQLASDVPLAERALASRASLDVCVPHLQLTAYERLADDDEEPAWLSDLTAAVEQGDRLDRRGKSRLARVLPLRRRVALTLGYVVNRCWPRYARAIVPFHFQPLDTHGGGHANMLYLSFSGDRAGLTSVMVQVYEPNGIEAYRAYGSGSWALGSLDADLADLLLPLHGDVRVSVEGVGAGLQTLLGEWERTTNRRVVTVRRSGYPICQAMVYFVFSEFLRQNSLDLASFDKAVARQILNATSARHRLQRKLLRFLENLEAWARDEYPAALRRGVQELFAHSNVEEATVRLRQEDVQVLFDDPLCDAA